MIELTPTTALMLYLFLTLGVLMLIWAWSHYHQRGRKVSLTEQKLHICEYCHFAYVEDQTKSVNRCPQCNSYNSGNTK